MTHVRKLRHALRERVSRLVFPLVLCLSAGPILAADPTLTEQEQTAIVNRLSELIAQNYARPELSAGIGKQLRSWMEAGEFRDARDPNDFAGALSAKLGTIDRHFFVSWTAPGEVHPVDPMHDSDPKALAEVIAWARRDNFGFNKVQVLPGNVGYVEIQTFHDASYAGDAAVAAMKTVSNADALIFDLRNNTGGEPSMVQLLISYLVPATRPVELMRMIQRKGESNEVRQSWTLPYVPGQRMPKVPVFVLTSRKTGSAAEAFAYDLQAIGRARIVGQVTIGAALPVEEFEIGSGFYANISNKRTENPITGTNWQDVGVKPDVELGQGNALPHAHRLALQALAKHEADPQRQKELLWAEEELSAAERPLTMKQADAKAYVGRFGDRRIWWEHDGLYYQRASRSPKRMQMVSPDTFVHEEVSGFRTRFARDDKGRIVRLVDEWIVGHTEAFARSASSAN